MTMKLYDQHVHSTFSFDGKEALRSSAHKAKEKGLAGITFTEHFDVDPLDVSFGYLQYDAYHRTIEEVREELGGEFFLGRGLEIGEPHLAAYRRDLAEALAPMQLDFIIGSVHNIGSVKLSKYLIGREKDAFYTAYFAEVTEMARCADIDVVGHLDLAKRYGYPVFGSYDFARHRQEIAELLQVVADRGIGIEINTSGFRNSVGIPYPSLEILTLYRSLGGKYVTLGSDAHESKYLAADFPQAVALLKQAGFHEYYCYSARTPQAVPIP